MSPIMSEMYWIHKENKQKGIELYLRMNYYWGKKNILKI